MHGKKYRFHLLALPHTVTSHEYVACAYTQKVLKFGKMMGSRGHHIIHYGHERSELECDEHVTVITDEDLRKAYGDYDWRRGGFKFAMDDHAYRTFYSNAIVEVGKRKRPHDFILPFWGAGGRPVCDAHPDMICVEPGIGYAGGHWARWKIFESYAIYHAFLGIDSVGGCKQDWYDVVIPNYFDPADFTFREDKEDYFLFVGRVYNGKGVNLAIEMTSRIGAKLIICGQGSLVDCGFPETPSHVVEMGHVGLEQRRELMSKAKAGIVASMYNEPFGGVQMEFLMSGTPTLTTDWGSFTENNVHGLTGYRCRTIDEFCWAGENVHLIDPKDCRKWAMNFSLERIAPCYEAYFTNVMDVHIGKGFYQEHADRTSFVVMDRGLALPENRFRLEEEGRLKVPEHIMNEEKEKVAAGNRVRQGDAKIRSLLEELTSRRHGDLITRPLRLLAMEIPEERTAKWVEGKFESTTDIRHIQPRIPHVQGKLRTELRGEEEFELVVDWLEQAAALVTEAEMFSRWKFLWERTSPGGYCVVERRQGEEGDDAPPSLMESVYCGSTGTNLKIYYKPVSDEEINCMDATTAQTEHAHEDELGYWGECTYVCDHENIKHYVYAEKMKLACPDGKVIDAQGKSVLDVGGGPASMLLQCKNRGQCKVIDPLMDKYPEFVRRRYEENEIAAAAGGGEELDEEFGKWDEVWMYNVLQHTVNPKLIVENLRKCAKVVRIFEWLDTPVDHMHPHSLTKLKMQWWLDQAGEVDYLAERGCFGNAFFGEFRGDEEWNETSANDEKAKVTVVVAAADNENEEKSKIKSSKPKPRVAVWSQGELCLARIHRDVAECLKELCDFEFYDWSEWQNNNRLWVEGEWRNFDVILGTSSVAWYSEQLSKLTPEMLRKMVAVVHTEVFDNQRFCEKIVHLVGPTYCGISVDVVSCIKAQYGVEAMLTPIGVNLDHFYPTRHVKEVKRLGFIGWPSRENQEWNEIKRPDWFVEIAERLGLEPVFLYGKSYKIHKELYEGIDMLIYTSVSEGFGMGIAEAAACKIPVVSTSVGIAKSLKTIRTFDTVEGGVALISELMSSSESLLEYAKTLHEEVVRRLDWRAIAEAYWYPAILRAQENSSSS